MADDTIKLQLDPIDVGPLDKLAGAAKRAEKETYDLADTYEVLAAAATKTAAPLHDLGHEVDEVGVLLADLARQETSLVAPITEAAQAIDREDDELNQLLATMGQRGVEFDKITNRNAEFAAGLERAATRTHSVAAGMDGVGRSSGSMGRGILEVSRGLEDMQYGLAGVLNNIPSAIAAFGGGAGLAGVISISAVGIKVLYDHWGDLRQLMGDARPIEVQAEGLKGLTAEVKKNEEAIDRLREKGSLNYDQWKKYNDLLKEQIDLEGRAAIARETEANKKAHGADADQDSKERASGFAKALDEAGGYEKVVKGFVDAAALDFHNDPNMVRSIRANFEQLFNQALKGDRSAIKSIVQANKQDKTGLAGIFDTFVDMFDPKKIKDRKLEKDLTEQGRQNEQANAEEQAKLKREAREKDAKLVDTLNAQGQANQATTFKERDQAAGKGAKKDVAEQVRQANAASKDQAAQAKEVGAGGLEKQAERRLAELMANGKMTARGPQPVGPEEAFRTVAKELEQFLRSQGVRGLKATGLAQGIAGNAEKDLNRRLVGMSGRNANLSTKIADVMGQLDNEVGRQAQQLDAVSQRVAQVERNGTNRRRNAQRRGN